MRVDVRGGSIEGSRDNSCQCVCEGAHKDLLENQRGYSPNNPTESDLKDFSENPLAAVQGTFSLVRFAFPSMITMAFLGLYTLVDVIFVARFVSTDALSAINIVCPVVNLIVGFATILATGGSAIIATRMGRGEEMQARRDFSLIVFFGVMCALAIAVLGITFLSPICRALGATDRLIPFCETYLVILLAFTPASVLQVLFQNLIITAGKPTLGTLMTVLSGVCNIVLDYLFMAYLNLGIAGAAWGTALGYTVAVIIGGAPSRN